MKKKPKETLSPLQQRRLLRIVIVLICLGFLWIIFAPNMGLVPLKKELNRLEALERQKIELEAEISALRQEIERIEHDVEYFERLAREKHGLLRKNEMIFDFDKNREGTD
ncbi:MAG: septum formation initiator family protein [Desulfopila sp.]|jgi:cell division protein FtsB|nr:septum formation initiator family protein [Desulfopila sp.]